MYASEEPLFPVVSPHDVYTTCLSNITRADLIVLLIDSRYGSIAGYESGLPLSITRKEYRLAKEHAKVVLIFVREETLSEETRFCEFLNKKGVEPSKEEFGSARSFLSLRVEDSLVFDFLSEIRANRDWIFSFRDVADVLTTIESQIPHFLQNALLEKGMTYRSLDLEMPAPSTRVLEELIDRSATYKPLNQAIMSILPLARSAASKAASIRGLVGLGELRAQTEQQYAAIQVGNILDAGATRKRLFVLDSSIEVFGPHVWRVDAAHQQVITASRQAARKYGLKGDRYTRVSIIFNPAHYLKDLDQGIWQASLQRHIELHRSLGLRLGIMLYSAVPSSLAGPFYNFYLIPRAVLEIFDQVNGCAFQIRWRDHPQLVSEFESFYGDVLRACDNQEGAFWVEAGMTLAEVIFKIGVLATL